MKRFIPLYAVFMMAAFPLTSHAESRCEEVVNVEVNGLVCDFCARALEKVFAKREEVADILVDLDNGQIAITMQPDQTVDDATLTELINDSGYNVTAIKKGC